MLATGGFNWGKACSYMYENVCLCVCVGVCTRMHTHTGSHACVQICEGQRKLWVLFLSAAFF